MLDAGETLEEMARLMRSFLLWSEAEYCARWIHGLNQLRMYYVHRFSFKKRKKSNSEIGDVEHCTRKNTSFP